MYSSGNSESSGNDRASGAYADSVREYAGGFSSASYGNSPVTRGYSGPFSDRQNFATSYSPFGPEYKAAGGNEGATFSRQTSQAQSIKDLYLTPIQNHVRPEQFLNTFRPNAPFISAKTPIHGYVEEAFKFLVGTEFPASIRLTVCTVDELRARHSGTWSDGIQGFSINRQGKGVNELFVRENPLDALMLTIGHEIGHVMSPTLPDPVDEEAKAFAFEFAWVETLLAHNIAGLERAFHLPPAKNGLHDKGFAFVAHIIQTGTDAREVFKDLVFGNISTLRTLERILVR